MNPARVILLLLFCWCTTAASGQKTVVTQIPDTLAFDSLINTPKKFDFSKRFDPRKALLFSAVLPGMGQVYNKKYWKLPLVYGGIGAGIYVMNFYQTEYSRTRTELLNSVSTNTFPSSPSGLTEATLRRAVDFYRRKRDFTIVLLGIGYLLQIVDAHVDAHLKEFKYNPNLRVSLVPEASQHPLTGRSTGMGLTITF